MLLPICCKVGQDEPRPAEIYLTVIPINADCANPGFQDLALLFLGGIVDATAELAAELIEINSLGGGHHGRLQGLHLPLSFFPLGNGVLQVCPGSAPGRFQFIIQHDVGAAEFPLLQLLNPGFQLPSLCITVLFGAGTTAGFCPGSRIGGAHVTACCLCLPQQPA